jgi:hypothetical protein
VERRLGRPLQSECGEQRLGQQKDTIHIHVSRVVMVEGGGGRWLAQGTGSAMLQAKGTKGCERSMAATTSAAPLRTAPGTAPPFGPARATSCCEP